MFWVGIVKEYVGGELCIIKDNIICDCLIVMFFDLL